MILVDALLFKYPVPDPAFFRIRIFPDPDWGFFRIWIQVADIHILSMNYFLSINS